MEDIRRCAGTRRDGSACTATVQPPQEWCWHHDPTLQERRTAHASHAARSKGKPPRIVAVQDRISDLVDAVERGELPTNKAAVMFSGLGILIKAIEQERKMRETSQVEERLGELEALLEEERTLRESRSRRAW